MLKTRQTVQQGSKIRFTAMSGVVIMSRRKIHDTRKWNLKNGIGLIPIGISIFYGLQLFLEKGTGGMFIIC